MGKLERRAGQSPDDSMLIELPERIRFNFHQRYSRRKRYHLAICSVMMVFGLWLVSPVFIILFNHLAFPSIGFSVVDNLSNAIMDITNLLMMVWNGVVNFQGILLGALSISVLIGMICLGAGAIWGIAYFIPLKTAQYGD
jgi:hypothetical protein